MATLTVVSDLHLEARPLSLDEILDPSISSDVLCLLGDIGDPSSGTYRDFLASCSIRFPTVLLLAGNNEYRNHDGSNRTMAQTEELIRQAAAAHSNVHFLQNTTYVRGNIAFIGTTMWSYLPDTPLPPPPSSDGEEKAAANGNTEPHQLGDAAAAVTSVTRMATGVNPVVVLPPPLPLPAIPGAGFMQDAAWGIGPIAAAASTSAKSAEAQGAIWGARTVASVTTTIATAAAAVAKRGDEAISAWRRRLPITGSEQLQGRQVQRGPRRQEEAQLMASGVVVPASWNSLSRVGQWGPPIPISTWRRVGRGCSSAALPPPPPPGSAGRGAVTTAPRFMSHSQPPADWLTPLGLSVLCSSGNCGGGCNGGCDAPGGTDRVCRRRRLRHCVSLSSLLPDEPCPSWRATNGGRCSGGGAASSGGGSTSSSSSSESDARSTDSDSSQSSDIDRSDSSPYATADSCRELTLPPEAGITVARTAGAGAADAGSLAASKVTSAVAPAPQLSSSLDQVDASCALKGGSDDGALTGKGHATTELGLQAMPVQAAVAAATPTAATATIPMFLSDPGSLNTSGLVVASAAGDARKPFTITTSATVAPAAIAPSASSAGDAVSVAAVPSVSSDAGTAPPLKPRSSHHHHHRHSSTSAHLPPPSTIREFIGATSLDYRRIFTSPGGPPITPEVTNSLFLSSLEFVRGAVTAAREGGLVPVVLSHHAPSMRGTSRPAFAGHPSTHAYSTDLGSYLADSGIAAWYCGHTHYNFDLQLPGGVRLASNQFGSQPKPADGYSRTWQHRLPAA